MADGPTLSPCVRFSVCPPSAAGLEDSRKHSINVRPPGVSVAFSFSSFCFGFYWFQFYTVISDTLEHSREKFFNLRSADFFLLYAPATAFTGAVMALLQEELLQNKLYKA